MLFVNIDREATQVGTTYLGGPADEESALCRGRATTSPSVTMRALFSLLSAPVSLWARCNLGLPSHLPHHKWAALYSLTSLYSCYVRMGRLTMISDGPKRTPQQISAPSSPSSRMKEHNGSDVELNNNLNKHSSACYFDESYTSMDIWCTLDQIPKVQISPWDVDPAHSRKIDDSIRCYCLDNRWGIIAAKSISHTTTNLHIFGILNRYKDRPIQIIARRVGVMDGDLWLNVFGSIQKSTDQAPNWFLHQLGVIYTCRKDEICCPREKFL